MEREHMNNFRFVKMYLLLEMALMYSYSFCVLTYMLYICKENPL